MLRGDACRNSLNPIALSLRKRKVSIHGSLPIKVSVTDLFGVHQEVTFYAMRIDVHCPDCYTLFVTEAAFLRYPFFH